MDKKFKCSIISMGAAIAVPLIIHFLGGYHFVKSIYNPLEKQETKISSNIQSIALWSASNTGINVELPNEHITFNWTSPPYKGYFRLHGLDKEGEAADFSYSFTLKNQDKLIIRAILQNGGGELNSLIWRGHAPIPIDDAIRKPQQKSRKEVR